MSEQGAERGAAEERSGAPATSAENNAPASPSSTPGGQAARADGAAEDAAGQAQGQGPQPTIDPAEDDPDREGEDRFDAG